MIIDNLAWNSCWRPYNIRIKMVICITAGAAALVFKSTLLHLLIFLLCGVLVFFSLRGKVSDRFVIMSRLWRLPLIFVLTGLLPFFIEISARQNEKLVAVTLENIPLVQLLAGRSLSVYAAVLLFAVTTPVVDLLDQLDHWHLPRTLLTLIALIYRQIFQLGSSFRRVISAAELRAGFCGFRRTNVTLGMLMGSILSDSMRQTENMSRALECRLYDGSSDAGWPVRKIGTHSDVAKPDLSEVCDS
ncbi:MAG: energy-coupling factor transporter transmembrane component T [Eubacteriales bacterium]|jgi:cobalt/nickel transport system permease protein|nr:energy-coupling factor transporter transmembrane component T [Eubacteriales bacterium]MDD3197039.1 energy-coupling factor transporter transmembrane component T [Eubacteriales bacterium]MDD3503939.1 energy-coupling factor transporter transmembrane component T [Eubacteriales bacterium]MDD4681933.1 energy-coupling factor transporter transmembrane component T [Eubacteriales bacterium]